LVLLRMHFPKPTPELCTGSSRLSQSKLRHTSPVVKPVGKVVAASQHRCLHKSTVTGFCAVPVMVWSLGTSIASFS